MNKYIENQSFKYKFAKNLLKEWLDTGGFDDLQHLDIKWEGDGIFCDYPIIKDSEKNTCQPIALNDIGGPIDMNSPVYNELLKNPTYDNILRCGGVPLAIFDIAYIYKGNIKFGFEIYLNHISQNDKKKLFNKYKDLEVYEINADTILNLTKKPNTILDICKRIS